MARFEIRVTIDCALSEVFATYTQLNPFRWTDMRSARWTCGNPWEVGSRLRLEPNDTYGTVVDQVLTHFEPNRFVGFISHFGGVTMQSQVHFRALSDTQTEIETQLEFIGRFSRMASFPLRPAIEQGARQVYEDLKRQCEPSATRKQRRSIRVPLKVEIEVQGIGKPLKCEGDTVVVSCHGALISTRVPLQMGMRIDVRVIPTERRGLADVVHVDPQRPRLCGIGLVKPQNLWGLSSPPHDWLAHDLKPASN